MLYLNKARQVISRYCDGSVSPTWETIAGIARYYHVSADWLIGLSEVRSTDTLVKDVCEYTGLSETAVEILHSEHLNEVNKLFEHPTAIRELIDQISVAVKAQKPKEITNTASEIWVNENGLVVLNWREAAEWHACHAGDMLRRLISVSQ